MKNVSALLNRPWILVVALLLGGCSLKAKNVKPSQPYDFAALTQIASFAQVVYSGDAAIRALCQPLFSEVHIRTLTATNNKYFIATSTGMRIQLIAIAGTANLENVLLDADITQAFVPELQISLHRGFSRAARLLFDDLQPHLRSGYRVQVTGHSLGGAEAVILAMMLQAAGRPVESVTTFGQPKVTNQMGVDQYKDLPLLRVVNQDDIVAEMPIAPYRHRGPVLVLLPGEKYSVVEERPLDPAKIVSAWEAMVNHQPPPDLIHHFILNYLANLESKTANSELVPYP